MWSLWEELWGRPCRKREWDIPGSWVGTCVRACVRLHGAVHRACMCAGLGLGPHSAAVPLSIAVPCRLCVGGDGYINGPTWGTPCRIVNAVGATALRATCWATGTWVRLCRAARGWVEGSRGPGWPPQLCHLKVGWASFWRRVPEVQA